MLKIHETQGFNLFTFTFVDFIQSIEHGGITLSPSSGLADPACHYCLQLLLSQSFIHPPLLKSSINFDIFFPLLLFPSTVPSSTAVGIHCPLIICPIQSVFVFKIVFKCSVFLCSAQNLLITHSSVSFSFPDSCYSTKIGSSSY